VRVPTIVLGGISFGESPRWHAGRLWFCDWGTGEILAVGPDGQAEVMGSVGSLPFSIDWLPDGRLLAVSARHRAVLPIGSDGALETYADLSGLGPYPPGNEIVTDGRGNVYVNGGGFDPVAGQPPAPGTIALITKREARLVAEDIQFGNGMVITPDNRTLIVAESHAQRLTAFDIDPDGALSGRRVWAEVGDDPPDGICIDSEGAVWYADVPHRRCVRLREGGEVLDTIELDRGCFACMLGGSNRATLFIVAREWHGMTDIHAGAGTGQIVAVPAPAPGAGWPAA